MTIESQREFVGRSLGTNVFTLMDFIGDPSFRRQENGAVGTRPADAQDHQGIERDLSESLCDDDRFSHSVQTCRSEEREACHTLVQGLKPTGIPDTIAYLTEEELGQASKDLEEVGYDPQLFHIALTAPPAPVDYFHVSIRSR